jgi:hypothetical protein
MFLERTHVKLYVAVGFLTLVATQTFSQGTIQFNNRLTGTSTSAVVAPVYDVDPNCPAQQKFGNPATAATAPIPAGTQTYGGAPLVGSGFTASLWARPAGSTGPFVQAATTPFRAAGSTLTPGFWVIPGTAAVLSNVPSDPAVRAEIIIRVWDNKGGTITSWDQLYDSATGALNLQNTSVHRGQSLPFVETDQLGGGTVLPPTLKGFESFQMYLPGGDPCPEPSIFALLGLAAGGLIVAARSAKQRR